VPRLWDGRDGRPIAELAGHTGAVSSAAFSPDGSRIVTASDDNTARVWSAREGRAGAVLAAHAGKVVNAVFSPDGSRIATGSADKTARLWNAVSGAQIAVLPGHENDAFVYGFTHDGRRLVTQSGFGALLWDADKREVIAPLKGRSTASSLNAFDDAVTKAFPSRAGHRIVTTHTDGKGRLWDAETGREVAALEGHKETIFNLEFSPDGRFVATASADHTVRLWDAGTGVALGVFEGHKDAAWHCAFSPDGTRLVTASFDGTARVWNIRSTTQSLVDHAKERVPRCLTREQRRQFFLAPEPPRWCITGAEREGSRWSGKWPFRTPAWQAWLAARDRGEKPALPAARE
jgi:WD40 repeat protein